MVFNIAKFKNFCSLTDNLKRVKKKALEWEKLFTLHITYKALGPRMYNELQIKKKNRNNLRE